MFALLALPRYSRLTLRISQALNLQLIMLRTFALFVDFLDRLCLVVRLPPAGTEIERYLLALKLSIHSDTKAEMKNKLKYALFSVLTFLLAATHVYAAAPHYFRTAVACPRGTTSGWIISPTETPALYRQAALFVGDPKKQK